MRWGSSDSGIAGRNTPRPRPTTPSGHGPLGTGTHTSPAFPRQPVERMPSVTSLGDRHAAQIVNQFRGFGHRRSQQ